MTVNRAPVDSPVDRRRRRGTRRRRKRQRAISLFLGASGLCGSVVDAQDAAAVPPPATIQTPLFHKGGAHHVQLFVGQPAVPQYLIVDTGSPLTAWLCLEHHQRKHRYLPERSSTAQIVPCKECEWNEYSNCKNVPELRQSACVVQQRYTEGSSWIGYEANEIVSVPSSADPKYRASLPSAIAFTFGCQTNVKGLFRRQTAHGILGLERHTNSSLPFQLFHQGILPSASYSLCLSRESGIMGLGGALTDTHKTPMQYTRLSNSTDTRHLSVLVEEFWLGDAVLTSLDQRSELFHAFGGNKGTILDSGTTDTYLPMAILDVFQESWWEQTGRVFDIGHPGATYSLDEFRKLPTLKFVLSNAVKLLIPASHYMEGASFYTNHTQGNVFLQNCVRFQKQDGAVLGINAMLEHDIHYDAVHDRLGIAPAKCS